MGALFSKPETPSPPNPIDTARAATGTNVATAIANANLQNINQVTPGGSLNYSTSGYYPFTDPTTGASYNIPQFTATQTLSPQGQAIKAQSDATQYNLAGMANAQSGRVAGLLSNNMDPTFNWQGYFNANPDAAAAFYGGTWGISDPATFAKTHFTAAHAGEGGYRTGWQAPQPGDPSNIANVPAAATSFQGGGPIQRSLGPQGDITQSYGPADNFSADRQRVEDSLMARMNPQLQIEQQRVQQQLADQGIRPGSQAYSDAMMNYSRQADDARWGAIQQAGTEQQRMTTEAAQQAAFQNQAQQQGYEQALGQGQFWNAGQGQLFQQNAAQAAFNNAGIAQQLQQQQAAFNAAQAGRNQYMQEQYAQRNQPINEITSLLSGSQVQQPNFVQTPGAQIPTTDIAGLVNQNFQQQLGIYQQQSQNQNQLLGGILGLGAGAMRGGMMGSDRRIKENITKMGTVFTADVDHDDDPEMGSVLADRKELPIYQYSYKADPTSTLHIGPMAQDIEKTDKGAVKTIAGVKTIDPRRVMGNILRAA